MDYLMYFLAGVLAAAILLVLLARLSLRREQAKRLQRLNKTMGRERLSSISTSSPKRSHGTKQRAARKDQQK